MTMAIVLRASPTLTPLVETVHGVKAALLVDKSLSNVFIAFPRINHFTECGADFVVRGVLDGSNVVLG